MKLYVIYRPDCGSAMLVHHAKNPAIGDLAMPTGAPEIVDWTFFKNNTSSLVYSSLDGFDNRSYASCRFMSKNNEQEFRAIRKTCSIATLIRIPYQDLLLVKEFQHDEVLFSIPLPLEDSDLRVVVEWLEANVP